MAHFSLRSELLEEESEIFASCAALAEEFAASAESLRNALNFRTRAREHISTRLRAAVRKLEASGASLRASSSALSGCASRYRYTEADIRRNAGDLRGMVEMIQIGRSESVFTQDWDELSAKFELSGLTLTSPDGSRTLDIGLLAGSASLNWEDSKYELKDRDRPHIAEHGQRYDPQTGKWVEDPDAKFDEVKGTVLEGSAELKVEADAARYRISKEHGQAELQIGSAEGHAKVAGGLYVYDKDKKKYLSPSINAEIGASYSLLTLTAAGTLGSTMLGGYADGKITIGKIGADAGLNASFLDADGSLNPQLYAHIGGEAILASAEGSLGATVLGGKVGVTGKATVGFDAHANVGFKDGVLKMDIGAAFGVGGSIGLELDVGGMVDTVMDSASSVVGTIADAASDAVDAVADFGASVWAEISSWW